MSRMRGFSLIEMVLGMAILVFVIAAGMVSLTKVSRGQSASDLARQAELELTKEAERVRKESSGNGFITIPTHQERQGEVSSKIQITRNISPIDQVTRTRTVNLEARWMEGGRERVQRYPAFEVGRVSAANGGAVVLRIVNAMTGVGVQGVRVKAAGQTSEWVRQTSNADGVVSLSGIRTTNPTTNELRDINISAEEIRYLFRPDNAVATQLGSPGTADFTKTIRIAILYDGYFDDSIPAIKVWPPGQIDIDVNILANAGALASLAQFPLDIRLVMNTSEVAGYTASAESDNTLALRSTQGSFLKVIPGEYWVVNLGSPRVAASAYPDDYKNPADLITVLPGEVKTKHFDTAVKGQVNLDILKVNTIDMQIHGTNVRGAEMGVYFFYDPKVVHHTGGSIDFSNTFFWKGNWGEKPAKFVVGFNGHHSGTGTIYTAPVVVDTELDSDGNFLYPIDEQWSDVRVRVSTVSFESQYLPILVTPDGSKMLLRDDREIEEVLPQGASFDDFKLTLHAQEMLTRTFGAPKKDLLANLRGDILNADGSPFAKAMLWSNVRAMGYDGPYTHGGVRFDGSMSSPEFGSVTQGPYLARVFYVHTYDEGSADSNGQLPKHYDFLRYNADGVTNVHRLVPNIGPYDAADPSNPTNKWKVRYRGVSDRHEISATFRGTAVFTQKIGVDDGTGTGHLVPTYQAISPGGVVQRWARSPQPPQDTVDATLSPNADGTYDYSFTKQVYQYTVYEGWSAPVRLDPTNNKSANITVNPPSPSYNNYWIEFLPDDPTGAPLWWVRNNQTSGLGILFKFRGTGSTGQLDYSPYYTTRPDPMDNGDPLYIWKMGQFKQIYGNVIDSSGAKVEGVTVKLVRTGFEDQNPPIDLTTASGVIYSVNGHGDYDYLFPNAAHSQNTFVPEEGWNLEIEASKNGYATIRQSWEAYEDFEVEFTILMTVPSVGGNAGCEECGKL